MDLINRYVYAVTKGLPEKQREDIEKELRTLIEDLLEQCQGPEPDDVKIKKVLLDLGDPEVLANNYRDSKRYLIGPQYYDTYLLVLKIVFGAVFLGITIAIFVDSIFSTQQNIVNIFVDYFSGLFFGLLQGFAWVTVSFTIAERCGANLLNEKLKKARWNLSLLPVIPEKKTVISRGEAIVSILFITIFLDILYFAPQLFAAYLQNKTDGILTIPIFDIEVFKSFRYLLVGIFIFSIAKEVLKLIAGRWTLKASILFTTLSVISTILVLLIFANTNVWNSNFSKEVMNYTGLTFDFVTFWAQVKVGLIVVIIAACIFEITTALYKGIKYNIAK